MATHPRQPRSGRRPVICMWACSLALPHGLAELPERRGSAECERCQQYLLLGLDYLRQHPGGDLGGACKVNSGGLVQVTGTNAKASFLDLEADCAAFWGTKASSGICTDADALLRFRALREALCMDTMVCNAYTVWNASEEAIWRQMLGVQFDDAAGVQGTCAGVSVDELQGVTESSIDDDWLGDNLAIAIEDQAKEIPPAVTEAAAAPATEVLLAPNSDVSTRRGEPPQGQPPGDPLNPSCPPGYVDTYSDLRTVRVVVVVFSGRGSRLRILFPYLRRDLRTNGGVIDRIICALIRPDALALRLIDKMKDLHGESMEVRDYTEEKWGRSAADPSRHRMAQLYTSLNEMDTVYIKVDDDIVYVQQHAIAELVREKLRGRCLFVSANVVNHAILSSIHQELGAHREFAPPPEFEQDPTSQQPWVRVGDVNFDPSYVFERHPMGSCVLKRWDCAVIAHESFLDRHREGTLCAFDFGWLDFNRAGYREHSYVHLSPWVGQTWEAKGARWSINFFAFQAEDFQGVDWSRVYGPGDDEEEFGGGQGERRNKHACALGRSLVVHLSYNTQEERLMRFTNLLDRYAELLANGSAAAFTLG